MGVVSQASDGQDRATDQELTSRDHAHHRIRMASKTTAAIEAPTTAIHSGFHNLNRAVAATNPETSLHDCNEQLEEEEPTDEESPVVLAETLV